MTDLAEFLLARIAEDEQTAKAAETRNGAAWTTRELLDGVRIDGTVKPGNPRQSDTELWDDEGAMGMWAETGTHVVRHDPARVLAECDAKRRIVAELVKCGWIERQGHRSGYAQGELGAYQSAAKFLTLPYADHPDYREEWRV